MASGTTTFKGQLDYSWQKNGSMRGETDFFSLKIMTGPPTSWDAITPLCNDQKSLILKYGSKQSQFLLYMTVCVLNNSIKRKFENNKN